LYLAYSERLVVKGRREKDMVFREENKGFKMKECFKMRIF